MVAGLSIQTGQSAVQHVVVEHVNELVLVPTPPPAHGGKGCEGDAKETEACNNKPCAGRYF